MLLLGLAVIAFVFYDAFITAVSGVSAGGPATHRLGMAAWKVIRLLARSPRSPLLAAAGPLVVFGMLVFWLVGLWAGWSLVFSADPTAVLHADTGEQADGWSRVYFAGYAVYTLGVGDFSPHGGPWQVLTVSATINGFVLLTMSVSYLIPVVMAVSERFQHGMVLHGLGDTAQGLLLTSWNGADFSELRPHLQQLTQVVGRTTQKFLSYPVLHFFHSPTRDSALEPGIAALDEALLLLEHGVVDEVRPHPLQLRPLRAALDRFSEIVAREFTGSADDPPPPPSLEPLRRAGIPVRDEATFVEAVAARQAHRRRLAAFIGDARWPWDEGVEVDAAPEGP
jgi:hypothetical protein